MIRDQYILNEGVCFGLSALTDWSQCYKIRCIHAQRLEMFRGSYLNINGKDTSQKWQVQPWPWLMTHDTDECAFVRLIIHGDLYPFLWRNSCNILILSNFSYLSIYLGGYLKVIWIIKHRVIARVKVNYGTVYLKKMSQTLFFVPAWHIYMNTNKWIYIDYLY